MKESWNFNWPVVVVFGFFSIVPWALLFRAILPDNIRLYMVIGQGAALVVYAISLFRGLARQKKRHEEVMRKLWEERDAIMRRWG
jgi:hypothetical protein